MGLPFLGYERGDFVAMIEEIAQTVENLSFGNVQGIRDLEDGFALKVKRGDMPHRDAQSVNNRFATANPVASNVLQIEAYGLQFNKNLQSLQIELEVA